MSDETPAEMPADVPETPKKAKKSKKALIIVLAVVLAGAGGGTYAMLRASSESATPTRGLVPFDPFVVNLADPGGMRFIRVTMQVVVRDEAGAKEVMESLLTLKESRSAILEILSQQMAGELVKVEGKQALKKAIVERLSKQIKQTKVLDVFFSEFVVQF
jgi:flagellar FliL protein